MRMYKHSSPMTKPLKMFTVGMYEIWKYFIGIPISEIVSVQPLYSCRPCQGVAAGSSGTSSRNRGEFFSVKGWDQYTPSRVTCSETVITFSYICSPWLGSKGPWLIWIINPISFESQRYKWIGNLLYWLWKGNIIVFFKLYYICSSLALMTRYI